MIKSSNIQVKVKREIADLTR